MQGAIFAALLLITAGCGLSEPTDNTPSRPPVPVTNVDEGLAFPRSTVGPAAPRFLSGDTAEADAGPKDWVMVSLDQRRDDDKYTVYGYVPKGQDSTHWTEFISYMNTRRPNETPLAFMLRQKALFRHKCPAVRFAVIKQSDSDITYESKVAECNQLADQDEIVRVIYGRVNLFRLSYTCRSADMPATQRSNAIELLSEFQLRIRQ